MERKTKSRGKIWKKEFISIYIMIIPALAYLLINNYIPMFGLVLAFKKINFSVGIFKSKFCGFSNFTYLFKTRDAFIIFRNTILYNIAFIALGTLLGVAVAILLNEVRNKFAQKTYQTVILLPYLISSVILSYLVYAFLGKDGFINNSILVPFGMKEISWYTTAKYWPVILVIVFLWKSFGYTTIMYFATVVGIDKSYYEAAVVDGAGTWKQIRYITLPCLKPTIVIMVLMSLGRMFYSDFGLFYQVPMNNGILYDVTNTIDTYVYRGLLQLNDIGRSSAAGFVQSLFGFIVVMTANAIVNKVSKENALF